MVSHHARWGAISPPPTRKVLSPVATEPAVEGGTHDAPSDGDGEVVRSEAPPLDVGPTLAAIESGQAQIRDHLEHFAKHLGHATKPSPGPGLSIDGFRDLYRRNQHSNGRHFVVHQHDHPISGVHYDLRLQFSDSSTISFAIPYGLPGNPNSIRPNRMAIETRVHNLWNNLIESASHATGSLAIWDTGEYEVLDRPRKKTRLTDDELSDDEPEDAKATQSQSQRLFAAFQSRHVHLRLSGRRLPQGYTIAMRLPSQDATKQPRTPRIKRRRIDPAVAAARAKSKAGLTDTDSDRGEPLAPMMGATAEDDDAAIASDPESGAADSLIRATNAYPGASNTIGSIHQRHWFLTLDRRRSGFLKARKVGSSEGLWEGPWEPFFVRGREVERSVVTGRLADEVMADEGVEGFAGRKMWRPIIE
ncbi:hypothetical protein LTR53_001949 [Teratosphaeriaceae sp. CCFEE 6253]|nr:hypothetical protein LTR53_001949 [Teratosphaeriaceae sp. CCFEE 6253]